ncbi:MAG: hypothetical protein OEX07_00165 [Gammaproteobacteria bacterium]|nr:hypothetical protein [Gammaproteobacteria bacterium]
MPENKRVKHKKNPGGIDEAQWGESSNFGYKTDEERKDKRGLEDWEMVSSMEQSTVGIPFWFVAIFIVLLIVAVGLTFPFWGNRPGYERPWFDWGIPAGVAWVVCMSFVIYYFVEMVPAKRQKQAQAEELAKKSNESKESEAANVQNNEAKRSEANDSKNEN